MNDRRKAGEDEPTIAAAAVAPGPSRRPGASAIAGRYEILAFLGQGGMGSVYRVHDAELDEVVALKFLNRDAFARAGDLHRFRQEVKLARRVTHRNVARTFDIGEHDGGRFLTMEYVEGEPLSALLAREAALPLRRTLELALQLCAGLAAAHAAGVIHRDMKPDNALLDRAGRIVITDFGIAHAQHGGGASDGIVGTAAYMAPEQVEGRVDVDGRADLYALGVMLYEMVTGVQPWMGATMLATAAMRLVSPPPDPRTCVPDLSPRLAETIVRCMARSRDDRFASATDVASAVELVLATLDLAPRSALTSAIASASRVAPMPGARATTVLLVPFRNAGTSGDDDLAAEITDDLGDVLRTTAGLRVRTRAALMARADDRGALDVARSLGAHVIVDGTVERAHGVVRVSARLTSAAEGLRVWAQSFEHRDPLALNDELARAVTHALTVESNEETRHGPEDSDVLDLYVHARRALRRAWDGSGDVREALGAFERGLARAPNDAGLLSGYAMARARAFNYATSDADADLAKARTAAERAIEVAPRSGEAWLALATLHHVTSEWADAVRALRAALARSPGLLQAQSQLGVIELEVGRVDQAVFRFETVLSIDPAAAGAHSELARAHALSGRYDAAAAQLESPDLPEGDRWSAAALQRRIAGWRGEKPTPMPESTGVFGAVSAAYGAALEGRPVLEALASLEASVDTAHPRSRLRPLLLQLLVEIHALRGDLERAELALARAADEALYDLVWLESCPILAELRGRPRFVEIRARVADRVTPVLAALIA